MNWISPTWWANYTGHEIVREKQASSPQMKHSNLVMPSNYISWIKGAKQSKMGFKKPSCIKLVLSVVLDWSIASKSNLETFMQYLDLAILYAWCVEIHNTILLHTTDSTFAALFISKILAWMHTSSTPGSPAVPSASRACSWPAIVHRSLMPTEWAVSIICLIWLATSSGDHWRWGYTSWRPSIAFNHWLGSAIALWLAQSAPEPCESHKQPLPHTAPRCGSNQLQR